MNRSPNEIIEMHEIGELEADLHTARTMDADDPKAVERLIEHVEELFRRDLLTAAGAQYIVSNLCRRKTHE